MSNSAKVQARSERIERVKATPPSRLINLSRAYAVMKEQGLDAMVATTHRNLYYTSGHMPDSVLGDFQDLTAAAVLPGDEKRYPTLVASDYDLAYLVTRPTWMPQVRMFGAKERSSATFLLEVLSRGIRSFASLSELPIRRRARLSNPTYTLRWHERWTTASLAGRFELPSMT